MVWCGPVVNTCLACFCAKPELDSLHSKTNKKVKTQYNNKPSACLFLNPSPSRLCALETWHKVFQSGGLAEKGHHAKALPPSIHYNSFTHEENHGVIFKDSFSPINLYIYNFHTFFSDLNDMFISQDYKTLTYHFSFGMKMCGYSNYGIEK